MTSRADASQNGDQRLPALHECSSLVSSVTSHKQQTSALHERASEWAAEIRRNISLYVDRHEDVNEDDVMKLKQELIAVFITTLQQDSRSAWGYLCEVLQLLEGYREYLDYFETRAEFHHYLERLVHHVNKHRERLFDLQIEQHLERVFPEEIERLKKQGANPSRDYCTVSAYKSPAVSSSVPLVSLSTLQAVQGRRGRLLLPDGSCPYSAHIPNEDEILAAKKLTFGDIRRSLGSVAFEMAARESVWSQALGTTALALSTNIPEDPKSHAQVVFDANYNSHPSVPLTLPKTPRPSPRKDSREDIPVISGREAVQFFGGCNHIGKIKSLFFNLAPSRHFAPYDLISVPKAKVNPEHYVFSSFGVLHVYPDQPSESMTLAEWQREAVLWKAASAIPFFKNFLIRKIFHRWRRNKLYLDFLRHRQMVAKTLLANIPAFGAALQQVSRLLKELITIQFLPFETNKMYQLTEYENNINYKNIQAERILEKFFRYCKMVVDTVAEESFRKMKYCEEQVKKKTYFSKDSLHLQKIKKEEREKNLQKAKSESGRLGNFVKLVDQMVVEHLFQITKSQLISFVRDVLMIGTAAQRAGFFRASLVFNKQDMLCLSPSRERFQKVLSSTLNGVPAVLCICAIAMDGSQQDREFVDTDFSLHVQHEPKISSSQMQREIKSVSTFQISLHNHDSMTVSEKNSQMEEGSVENSAAEQESSVQSANVDSFPVPHLPRVELPTKSEDNLGIATPDLVLPAQRDERLEVEGKGFLGQYSPLSRASLEEKLALDEEYQAALQSQQNFMQSALEEIDAYCEFNHWLCEIHVFCRSWNEKSVKDFRGAVAFTIEQKLTEIRQWSEKVRNFDRSFTTENGMFFVDCSAIHEGLVPRLNDIYQQLIAFVADEAKSLAVAFCDEMKIMLKNMKDKRETVQSFAQFAKNYSQYKKNTLHFQQRVEYIKSLYEVVRMSSRQLTSEEEKVEESVWAAWEAFLMQMQDASEFINTQTPLMTQQLQQTFEALEKEAKQLAEQATSGCFLDPNQNPLHVLKIMKDLREKFFRTQLQLQEASQWGEAIAGEPYNLKFLNEITVRMDVRQELWKYVEVSSSAIKDWKQMLFRKMNIKKALEKVTEWMSAATQLRPYLPADDRVLTSWYSSLQDFRKDLPVLYKLANDALKDRHWHAIFLGMNEPYMGSSQFTVGELMGYNLSDDAELVDSVYLSAVAEYDLEQLMASIKRMWQEKNFKIAKHIPDSVFIKDSGRRPVSVRKATKLERYRQERVAAAAGGSRSLDVANDDLYVLIEVEELKYQLENSRISVETMLQSPYIGDIESEAQEWRHALCEIEEITDLWITCQKKWLYLLKIFEQPNLYRKLAQQAFKFEAVHAKFKDWMRVVSNDSKVLSIVNRRRGEKGYRLLQGDNLRSLFLSLIQQQEEILKDLELYLEKHRARFPRLYFLSDGDLIDMIGISRSPQSLVPFVRKCFPGITDLTFVLPPGLEGLHTVLDFALNSDKLQVACMKGAYGEEVSLYTCLEPPAQASIWLHNLESIMKNTMTILLQACVQECMEEGTRQPVLILEELSRMGKDQLPETAELTSEIRQKYQHWLLHFPAQCVQVTDCILWERSMARILEKMDQEEMKCLRTNLSAKIEQYVNVLRESHMNPDLDSNMQERLSCLLSSLVTQSIHHRDIMDNLLQEQAVMDSNFDWLKVLKFRMDIRNVLRAKTTVSDGAKQTATSPKIQHQRKAQGSMQKREALDEIPHLSRTKTTVSTDYDFSPCYVQQLTNTFFYDYEYLGPSPGLVITPLTERTILSLTQSLRAFHCSMLIGPSGTGKTDTIQHLGKMLGRCMFTFTCSESVSLPIMLQYMTGMVQSGCWALFDDVGGLTTGLMSVAAQQLDYLHTALRALDLSSKNQYLIRGQPRFDKILSVKPGAGDKVIRRNSLTTLHPLPRAEALPSPELERQRTVPHGFNEKGLVTYFEDTWVAEREQRRHSIEREIEIKESDLYKNNRPPPLFYEHVRASRRRAAPDYTKLVLEPSYVRRFLGNVMFNGKLILANSNFGCFMTTHMTGTWQAVLPDSFRVLMRPCALIKPDVYQILSVLLQTYGFQEHAWWARKVALFLKLMQTKLPRRAYYQRPLQDVKKVAAIAAAKCWDHHFLPDASREPSNGKEMDTRAGEECCLGWALHQVLAPQVAEEDQMAFSALLHDVFPQIAGQVMKGAGSEKAELPLVLAIKEVMREDRLQEIEPFIQKVLELNAGLECHSPVALVGPAGSGKTSCFHVLARAINLLNYKLFAPDHADDELTADHSGLQSTPRLKILPQQEMGNVDKEQTQLPDTQMLKDISEEPKLKPVTGLKKPPKFEPASGTVQHSSVQAAGENYSRLWPFDVAKYPKVDVVHLVPTAMEPKELLGQFREGVWEGGLIGKIAQDSYFMSQANKMYIEALQNAAKKDKRFQGEIPSVLLRWLVLDGDLDCSWTDGMKTLFEGDHCLSLANGENIQLKDTTFLIFETASLVNASPAAVSRCTVVNFGETTSHWSSLYYTWKQTAKTRWLLTAGSMKILDDLVQDVFPPTIRFLQKDCCTALLTDICVSTTKVNAMTAGVPEMDSFLKIFSALLDRVLMRADLEKKTRLNESRSQTRLGLVPDGKVSRQMASRLTNSSQIEAFIPHYIDNIKNMFAFAFIWSFGGHLHDRFRDKFSKFAQDMLYRAVHSVHLPECGQVFDYCVDDISGSFVRWSDRHQDKMKPLGSNFCLTPEMERYSYLLDLMLTKHHAVLLSGSPGVGKSALVKNMVLTKHVSSTITMSQGVSASNLQRSMLSHIVEMQSKAMNVMPGPGPGQGSVQSNQRHLFFIDDLNMAPKLGSYQPPVEVLRHVLCTGGTYDQQRQAFQQMKEALFVAAATFPSSAGSGLGHATHSLSSRLLRQFVNLTVFTPSTETILSIYSRPLQAWLEEFPTYSVEHHHEFARALSLALLELYHTVKEHLRPTPVHAHYVYNLHDISRVVHGILLMSPRSHARKLRTHKKSEDPKSRVVGRSSSFESMRSRTVSLSSPTGQAEASGGAPMMKIVAQLWCHECTRNFADRLVSSEDHNWFTTVLEEVAVKHFCLPRDDPRLEMASIKEEPGASWPTPAPHPHTPVSAAATTVEMDTCDVPKIVEIEIEKHESQTPVRTSAKWRRDGKSHEQPLERLVSSEAAEDLHKPCSDTPSGDTSFTLSAATLGGTTIDGNTPKAGCEDRTAAVQTHTTDSDCKVQSEAEGKSRTHDDEWQHSDASEDLSEDMASSDEAETATSVSDSTKATPDLLGSTWETERLKGNVDHESMTRIVFPDPPVAPVPPVSTSQKHQSSRAGGARRGVTFKTGLIADKEDEAYYGPLLAAEDVRGLSRMQADFIFSKYFLTCHSETLGLPGEKGYLESSVDALAEALKTCLSVYNEGTSQRLDLVFFSEAVHHAARLSRVFAHPQGHALLLGMSYSTGRATLTRLAAYIAHCKLFEPKPQADPTHNGAVVKEHMKRSCYYAGVVGKSTVLLLHEDLGDELLHDISVLMAQGTSPGLYSEDELQTIVGHMMPGGVQTKRVDKIEQAFQRFVKRVCQNLHIVVCLNYKGNSFSSDFRSMNKKLQQHPGLLKNAFSVDLYQPWSFCTFSHVANAWLEDHWSLVKIPWNMARKSEQAKMASDAMAYIHLSAKAAVERQYCHEREPLRFYSPLTFLEFVHLFRVISAYIVKKEKEKATKYEKALGKINEAFGSIAEYRQEVSNLAPRHKTAHDTVRSLVEDVEKQKQDYIQALDRCKVQEEKITELQGPLEQLRKSAQSEFDRVNPVYEAAQRAIDALNPRDIDEIKSFPSPPEQVKFLMMAVCLMFSKPQTWENSKVLLIRENFKQDLIFYDKDNIPDDIFEALKEFVNHPDFQPNKMKSISKAASGLCMWVIAIHHYSSIYRKMQPHLKNLLEAENRFTRVQAQLGQLRVEAHRIKSGLEGTISHHKEALKEARTIEKTIQGIERKIARASNLMENMSMQHFLWRAELRKARRHILAAPGDALITAACICYHGPLDDKSRQELITDWLDRCRQGTFHMQAFQEHNPYSVIARLEVLLETQSSQMGRQVTDDAHSIHSGSDTAVSEASSTLHSMPQVRTFKYMPAIYDTSKFYKSELKKTDTMESMQPDDTELDDSDDEEDPSPLATRSGYTIQDILSDFDELSDWRMHSLPTDLHAIQNALLMRVNCHNRRHCWPLLLDPDNQAEMWVKALQGSRNIFTVHDVAVEEDRGIPLEKANQNSEHDHTEKWPPEPPPSRGTALTFSDVTEHTVANSEYTLTSYTQTSQGWTSHPYEVRDELRPVTSVTGSWDTGSHHAASTMDQQGAGLWVVEADDPAVNSKLISAMVHGITVLVTHLERRPLATVFRGLLLKQFYVDHDGSRVVRVGDMQLKIHPSFCLYLSTTVPLFLKGDGLYSIPIHRMCIINMAVSDEAIINRLLFETMKVERKEFEGQRRSNENDIILHRQRLVQEHEAIREKTLNLDGPLLEDGTMLESVMKCRDNVQHNRIILEETRYMGDHLQGKFAHYLPLVVNGTVLYNILHRMTVLHPMYYVPFYKFVDIFAQVIKSRDRGKGSLGAPQARAQELSDAVTAAVFHHASMMMFELHYNLLSLLVTLERLRIGHKASHKELSLFINGFEKHGLDEASILEQKPVWMDSTAWVDCSILESLQHPFHGLCSSVVHNSEQWQEYFQLPVVLLNPVPGTTLQELSIFQKCLLWKICCPHRFSELTQAIVNYELGSAIAACDHYNIREVYASMDQYTPVVFVLPAQVQGLACYASQGQPYVSPVHEVKRLAREIGMEGKVRIMNFGVRSQDSEMWQALDDCIHAGNWLLLQNYHLATGLGPQFYTMLKDLVYARWMEEELHGEKPDAGEDHSLVTRSRPSTHLRRSHINPTFRLWLTTSADAQHILPGILTQHGLRVTCETTANFRSTLQKTYRSAAFLLNRLTSADEESVERLTRVMPLALLHALLLHQSYFGQYAFAHPYYWTLSDLGLAVEVFRLLMLPSHSPCPVADLIAAAYANHCTDSTDVRVVCALVQDLVIQKSQLQQPSGGGARQLLCRLLQAGAERHSLKRILDVIEDTSARTFSLPEQAQHKLLTSSSRIMLSDLVQVTGAPELLLDIRLSVHMVVIAPQVIVPQLLAMVATCPSLPLSDEHQIMPLDQFLHMEIEGFRKLLELIEGDLLLLQRHISGELSITHTLQDTLETLCSDCIPCHWLTMTFATCRSVRQWLGGLAERVRYVQKSYVRHPASLWLPAFLRPDRLFPAVSQTCAKHSFIDVGDISLDFQVMPTGFTAMSPPSHGVFVHGLQLSNATWSTSHGVLDELLPGVATVEPLPTLWIKPHEAGGEQVTRRAVQDVYLCPLFASPDVELQQDSSLVTHLPLPTLVPPSIWTQNRVTLSCHQSQLKMS